MTSLDIQGLIGQFNALEGTCMVETQRNFSRYFTTVKNLLKTKEHQESFVNNIHPKTRMERMYQARIFLHYKCVQQLWNIVLSEDRQVMANVLRSKWFFNEGFAEVTPDILINEIFPKVSYLLRLRILNRISRSSIDDNKCDLFFEAVLKNYGLVQALILLPTCSINFILRTVQDNYYFTISKTDLLRLHKRDSAFAERYFTIKQQKNQAIQNYSLLLEYLARHDTNAYWKLKHGFVLHVTLNRKQTERVMSLYKAEVLKNVAYYSKYYNMKGLVAKLSPYEFKVFFKQLFPRTPSDFKSQHLVTDLNCGLFKYLWKFDRSRWLPMIEEAFYEVYNERLRDHLDLINKAVLKLIPSDERTPVIEQLIAKDSKEKWICFYPTTKSLAILKNKINLTAQIPQRIKYIAMLVTTCEFNNDEDALLEVLKYFENRHKNDDIALKLEFFASINESFKIDLLTMEHLKILKDIMTYYHFKHASWFAGAEDIITKILKHHINHNLPIRDILIFYLKMDQRRDDFNLFENSPKEAKFVLLAIPDMIEDLSIATNPTKANKWSFYSLYVKSLVNFNQKHRRDPIPLSQYPFITTFFKNIAGDKNYIISLMDFIKVTSYDIEVQNLLCESYWKACKDKAFGLYNFEGNVMWFLKYKPQFICNNLDLVVANQYFNQNQFQRLINHPDLQEMLVPILKDLLLDMDDVTDTEIPQYKIAVLALSTHPEVVNIMKPYFPLKSATVTSNKDLIVYYVQKMILKSFELVPMPSGILESMLLFMKDHYLLTALSTLYVIAKNTPINKLSDFLRVLSNRAVSVRKHAIFLNSEIMNTDEVYDMLMKCGERENNPSLRKFILRRTVKYFLENGDERFWHLMKVQMFLLNTDDKEGHEMLLVLNRLPIKYQAEYVEILWQLLAASQNKQINDLKYSLLGSIHQTLFLKLSDSFCDEVIRSTLLGNREKFCENGIEIQQFIYNCFMYGDENKISVRLDFIFGIFRELLNSAEITDSSPREIIQQFVVSCCTYLVIKKKTENYPAVVNILELLRIKWTGSFNALIAFHPFLILNFTAIYFECSRIRFESVSFVQKLGSFFDFIVEKFDISIIHLFSNIARQFLRIICATEVLDYNECLLHTLKALSIDKEKTHRLLLVITTLPITIPTTAALKMLHLSILDSLRMSEIEMVQLHFNVYLNKVTVE